jgi:Cu-Zn family superoxide dismutase
MTPALSCPRHFAPFTLMLVAGCARSGGGGTPAPIVATELRLADGRPAGTVELREEKDAVRIRFRLQSLPPGPHAAHVHMSGLCEPPGFTSAGGHLNPAGRRHGHRHPDGWHLGDLGTLMVGADGRADTTIVVPDATVGAGPRSLLGAGATALVLHERADDEMTDPAGNAGTRIACGVLRRE